MVSLDTDGEWAAWSGFDCVTDGERKSVVLVAIAVTAFATAPGAAPAEELAAMLRARHPAGTAVIDELAAADGNPALRIRCTVTEQRGGRSVTTGQAQAFVLFPGAGALGVVSAVCPIPPTWTALACWSPGSPRGWRSPPPRRRPDAHRTEEVPGRAFTGPSRVRGPALR